MASSLTIVVVKITFLVSTGTICRENLSSKNWVEKDRTMLSKVHFTSVEISFGKKLLMVFKKPFSAGGQMLFPRVCLREHLRENYPKNSSLFELLSQEIWLVLSERLSTAAEKSFWNRNVLKILQNYRKLSSNTVSRCYRFCVPCVQRNILGGILRKEQKIFAAFLAWRTLQKTENIRIFERKNYGCCCQKCVPRVSKNILSEKLKVDFC